MPGPIVWAAGVAASPLVGHAGRALDRAGRVIVEPDLSIPGHPEVFVVGDAAAFLHQGGTLLPGVAQTAMQGAAHAAKNILRRVRGESSVPFVYRNLGNMAIVGRGSAVADLPWARSAGRHRLARVALPAHRDADRFPQPRRRPLRVGSRVPDLPARGEVDHGRSIATIVNCRVLDGGSKEQDPPCTAACHASRRAPRDVPADVYRILS